MIVKVQISQVTTEGKPQMLVYDELQTLWYQGNATKEVMNLMGGESKKFFYSEIKNKARQLGKEAPWQNW